MTGRTDKDRVGAGARKRSKVVRWQGLLIFVVLGAIMRANGFNLLRTLRYVKEELLIVAGTSSSETALPGLILIAFKLIFAGSFAFLAQYPWLPFSVLKPASAPMFGGAKRSPRAALFSRVSASDSLNHSSAVKLIQLLRSLQEY